jgi:hypothetical protein
VYRNVERIMEPFRGMFPTHALNDRSVVDFSLLFAMIVYASRPWPSPSSPRRSITPRRRASRSLPPISRAIFRVRHRPNA